MRKTIIKATEFGGNYRTIVKKILEASAEVSSNGEPFPEALVQRLIPYLKYAVEHFHNVDRRVIPSSSTTTLEGNTQYEFAMGHYVTY